MNCEDFEARISGYLEKDLREHELRMFLEHMQTCQSCCDLVVGVRAVRVALQGMGAMAAPPLFQLRVVPGMRKSLEAASLYLRSLALGLALTVAVVIVLWPQDEAGECGIPAWSSSSTLRSDRYAVKTMTPVCAQWDQLSAGLPEADSARSTVGSIRQVSF